MLSWGRTSVVHSPINKKNVLWELLRFRTLTVFSPIRHFLIHLQKQDMSVEDEKNPEMAEISRKFQKSSQNSMKIKEFMEFQAQNFLKSGIS